jgi:predicted dehydrogenase
MVKSMIAKSQEKQVFLMEAIWTRFHPAKSNQRDY